MTDLFITTLFVSMIIALGIEILLVKSFHKSCLTGDKNLFLTVGMTFLGIHLLITSPRMVSVKIWIIANLIGMWILYYYKEAIKEEIYSKNNFKLLKSQKRKKLLISSTLCYMFICFLLNYYIVCRFTFSSTALKLTVMLTIFFLLLTEIINIVYFLILLDFYCLAKVTIWGENLTKYEGWLIEETKDCYMLKEKFSGEIITIKKDIINQIIIMGRGF